jgi:hypothetical protein
MTEKLKPCPFCGEKATIEDCSYYDEKKSWSAMCGNPSCFAYTETHKTKSLAIERWNKRPIEEALQKRIEELEAERDRLKKNHAELGKKLGAMISFCGNLPEHLVTGEALEIFNEVYGG